jgi:hypothetical protein
MTSEMMMPGQLSNSGNCGDQEDHANYGGCCRAAIHFIAAFRGIETTRW